MQLKFVTSENLVYQATNIELLVSYYNMICIVVLVYYTEHI
jgi:hypothetical protein